MKKNKVDRLLAALIAARVPLARDMKRVMDVVRDTGPRPRTVLRGLCAGSERPLDKLLTLALLVPIGEKRATVYGTPAQKRRSK